MSENALRDFRDTDPYPPLKEWTQFRACLHGGGGPQDGEVTRLGGVTRNMLPHLPGVPHLHVNRP